MTSGVRPKSRDEQRVYSEVQARIAAGDYPPETWLPAERMLAEEFGVNRAVVRGAYQRLAEVGVIVRKPGHRPWVCPKPSRLYESSTDIRTIVGMMPQHPVYHASALILNSINLELRSQEAPFRLVVSNTHEADPVQSAKHEEKALIAALEENVAGVIIWHVGHTCTLPLLMDLQNRGIPVIFVDRRPESIACDFVGLDNQISAAEAVRYLLSLGHRRIAHITSTDPSITISERRAGYLQEMRRSGITPKDEWIYEVAVELDPDLSAAVKQFMSLPEPPTAVFAVNDALAHYFIVEAERAGFSVPGSISVVGFDDLERDLPRPALLTTMHQPFDRIGQRAAQLALTRLRPETADRPFQHVLFTAPLVVRSTCQPTERRNLQL